MINGKRVLAVIIARGGSKGLPRKNVLPLGGKPMIAWSIEAGKASRYVDRLILSSDDPEIIEAARAHGCDVPFMRPPELARDDAGVGPVLIHALDAVGGDYDWIVLLQATSPLRLPEDIDACLELADRTGAPAAISVTKPAKTPYWMVSLDEEGRMRRLLETPAGAANRRQALPDAYVPNGAVYVARTDSFRATNTFTLADTRAYIMPAERSIDIDYWIDLMVAETLLSRTSPVC